MKLALCMLLIPASLAFGQAEVTLSAPTCANVGDEIVVAVGVAAGAPEFVGLQSAISYDRTVLEFLSASTPAGPLDLPIYFSHSAVNGTIDLAVGITPPAAPITGGVDGKLLRFRVIANPASCPSGPLVTFRSDKRVRNLLTTDNGAPITPGLVNLSGLNIAAAPVISVPADASPVPPIGFMSVSADVGVATANGCGTVDIDFVRSDGKASLSDPFDRIDSPISIVWTATDACGRSDSGTQTVTVDVLLGDLSGDGIINGNDLAIVLGGFGSTNGQGDVNADGVVDGFDIAYILGNWGVTSGG
ncbi:MAG: hypothetical protein ACO3QC_08630 [Phycisphaerales bacterium]